MATKAIQIKNINQGGIADSDYIGNANSVAEAVGLDIHSESGLIKVNQKLTKDSGSTVDDFIRASVPCSDGNSYHFGSTNGKIWKRTGAGVWSLEATASPAAGAVGILGAKEYQGYIYYAMQNRLGRWQLGTAWSTRNDNWATFLNGNASFHPMKIINMVLYIGDGNVVAQVDVVTFSNNALDIEAPLIIKSLGRLNTDLLVGTYISDNVPEAQIIRWNTWSVSFSYSDPVPEAGVNCFLETDNNIIVSVGSKGNLYLYNGSSLEEFKRIKGVYTSTNKATVYDNASFNFNGMPLFGYSNISGNPANLGVYSLARTNRNYPYVLNLEHPISTANLSNILIGSICPISADQFLVTWKDTTTGTVYGVDVLDLTAKVPLAWFTTRVITHDRTVISNYKDLNVPYRSLPTGASIKIYKKVNSDTTFGTELTSVNDTDRLVVATEENISDATRVQSKVELIPNGNNAPEVEMLETLVD